ncbi:charged multivesicular body protein 1a-like [Watersipora subatra]|uniref:charged multivesicular body protein 1a-like n=1 Tax=Watersipora subatra TaxID=2589382 RepID=UPI00355C8F05
MPDSLQDTLFQLKFSGKQLDRFAKKAEKEQEKEKAKMKKAMTQHNIEGAKIYAENAIRKKNECLNFMRMSARLDAVSSRVQTAVSMKGVVKNLGVVTKGLDKAMASMNLEEVEKIMQKFETQFEDLDVRESTMEAAMGSAFATSAPGNQVEELMKQVASENDLDISEQLKDLHPGQSTLEASTASTAKEDNLSRRLAALRN